MRIKLVVVGGDVKTSEVAVSLPVVIGRGKEASLCLPHRLVSRAHCRLSEEDGQTLVEDLGSLNGTFVNNRRIKDPTILPFGQLLTIGDVTFRVVAETAAAAAKPAPVPAMGVPNETEATVHAGGAKPSIAAPDFTLASEDDDEASAGAMIESATEESDTEESAGSNGAPPKKAPAPSGPLNLPKFAPHKRRF